MAILLRKGGATSPVKIVPAKATKPEPEVQSPAPETYHVEEKAATAEPKTVTPPPATTSKPKAVFKVLGGHPITPRAQAPTDTDALARAAGIIGERKPAVKPDLPKDRPLTDKEVVAAYQWEHSPEHLAESKEKWPPCAIGTRVIITNSMFPWV
jgi:hypothetical protein